MKYIKYIAGILILVLVLNNSNLTDVLDLFRSVDYLLIAANLPVFIVGIAINSYKWNLLIPSYRFSTLFTSNLIAAYYSVFLPGQVASEGLKIYRLKDHKENDLPRLTCSVFVDKLIGVIGLLIVGSVGILLSSHKEKLMPILYAFGLTISAVLFLIFNTALIIKIFRFLSKSLTKLQIMKKLDELLLSFENSFNEILHGQYILIIKTILLSIIFQTINIFGNFIVAKAIHIELPFVDFLWIIALISIALVLPITIGGLGIRELSFVGIFKFLALPIEAALAFSIAGYGMLIYHSSFGYLVDLIWGVKPDPET
ncbi:MAG: flippase-like domain-containing protein [Candidatus Melainabacteria bacterium]|jgi:glycosyltransferase 2 family protein|nr:flippase-like domain-containing protein [Candidatus Melainabacteria bacterium]